VSFALTLPHGLCVGTEESGDVASLHPDERQHAERLAPVRRRDWVGGRAALRRAAELLGAVPLDGPVFADDRGAPRLPAGLVGSISHKDGVAVALVAAADGAAIGIDIERWAAPRTDIARRVLIEAELAMLAELDGEARGRAVALRFSIKEAIYKAIDPFVRRRVGFHEVAIAPADDGGCAVTLLPADASALQLEAAWRLHEGRILATARCRRG
jgi:4'-phosphopantetheinyl transferase EntD